MRCAAQSSAEWTAGNGAHGTVAATGCVGTLQVDVLRAELIDIRNEFEAKVGLSPPRGGPLLGAPCGCSRSSGRAPLRLRTPQASMGLDRVTGSSKGVMEPETGIPRSVFEVHKWNPVCHVLSRDARLVERASQILDDGVYIHQSRCVCGEGGGQGCGIRGRPQLTPAKRPLPPSIVPGSTSRVRSSAWAGELVGHCAYPPPLPAPPPPGTHTPGATASIGTPTSVRWRNNPALDALLTWDCRPRDVARRGRDATPALPLRGGELLDPSPAPLHR